MLINLILVAPTQLRPYTKPGAGLQRCAVHHRRLIARLGGGLFVFLQCREILSYLWWDGRYSSQLCRKDTGNQKVHSVL